MSVGTQSIGFGTADLLSDAVKGLLRLHRPESKRLVSRENSRLEYKESFNWANRAKYAKTMAAFANNEGGFIVFGVKDSPRDLVGVNRKRFDQLDPSKVVAYLNSAFAPEIRWESLVIEIARFELGVVAVEPAIERPIVCIKNDGHEIREADIYYRYRGRTERIRYPELQHLIAERERQERRAWLEHLSEVARIGVENVGILDLVNGELSGTGGRLLMSADLLKQVQFIREGHFTESHAHGIPTLRLAGDVKVVAPGSLGPVKTVAQPIAIGEKEILGGFLRQERPTAPHEYLKQACREKSWYMPVYHFARTAGMGLKELHAFVGRESVPPNRLLNRIAGSTVASVGSLDSDTPSSIERRRILGSLEANDIASLHSADRVRLFEAVTHGGPSVSQTGILDFLAELIGTEFEKFNSHQKSLFRKAVARIDEEMNRLAFVEPDSERMPS